MRRSSDQRHRIGGLPRLETKERKRRGMVEEGAIDEKATGEASDRGNPTLSPIEKSIALVIDGSRRDRLRFVGWREGSSDTFRREPETIITLFLA